MVGSTIQHYSVRSRLGKGGMGEVYLAEDTRLGREVALKMLPAGSQADPERRARLLTEARAASALRSSNIAAIYDIGEEDGHSFLVMEYVDGEPLSERLTRGALPTREALDVAIQVAEALDEAHGRGIVHRDIKSANIMLTRRGLVKVLDFGLAKFIESTDGRASIDSALTIEHTMAGMVLGTISYMSPEQALGKSVDGRSDLFSLGVVLYESLAAHLPFAGTSFAAVVNAILNQPPAPLVQYLETTPPQLESIVRRALEKKPELRYQTAREFQTDLSALRDGLDGHQRVLSSGIRARELSASQGTTEISNAIAVMTFTNITREPADEWIGSGIAETVGADLRSVPGVSVIGRERIFDALRNLQSADAAAMDDRFAIEVGRGLGARWIVSGGYQRAGTQLRITAHIVEVATGVTLRTVKIDGAVSEIFGLQDRIVFELTQGLELQVAGSAIAEIQRDETRSVEAYELYSRGSMTLRLASRDAPDRAISLFEKALAIDPEYAEAWAGLGGAYQIKGAFLNIPELLEKALEFERRALTLDPVLAEAQTWLGATLLSLGRVEQALEALQQAVNFADAAGGGVNGFAPEQQASLPPEIATAYASVLKAPPAPNFEQRWSIWNAGFGGSGKTNGNGVTGSSDTRLSTYGFAGGIDYRFSPYTVVGLAAGGAGTNWTLSNALGGGRSDSAQIGAYARTVIGPAYIAESIAVASHWFNTNRNALGDSLRANFTGESVGARIEGGYRIAVSPTIGMTPYAAAQAQAFRTAAYGETDLSNLGFGLNYAAKNSTDIRTEVGARFDSPTLLGGMPLVLRAKLAWAHDIVNTPSLNAALQALPLSNFTVFGAQIPHDSGLASIGADWYLNRDWKLLTKFDGEFAKGSNVYAGTAALRYSW